MLAYRHCIYGQSVASNIALTAEVASGSDTDAVFLWEEGPRPSRQNLRWYHHWEREDGRPWLSAAMGEEGFLLRFPGVADFLVTRDGHTIRGEATGGPLAPEAVDDLFVGHVLPLAVSLSDAAVLHASAACKADLAFVFAGDSGTGKSSGVAHLVARGYRWLGDDCAVLRRRKGSILVHPSRPSMRLWPGVHRLVFRDRAPGGDGRKFSLVRAAEFYSGPVPASRIFILCPRVGANPHLQPLAKSDAVIELLRNSFRLDLSREGLKRQLETFAGFTEQVDVCRLIYSSGIEGLERAIEHVLASTTIPAAAS